MLERDRDNSRRIEIEEIVRESILQNKSGVHLAIRSMLSEYYVKEQLPESTKKQITQFMWKSIALPGALITILSFGLGFFINDYARAIILKDVSAEVANTLSDVKAIVHIVNSLMQDVRAAKIEIDASKAVVQSIIAQKVAEISNTIMESPQFKSILDKVNNDALLDISVEIEKIKKFEVIIEKDTEKLIIKKGTAGVKSVSIPCPSQAPIVIGGGYELSSQTLQIMFSGPMKNRGEGWEVLVLNNGEEVERNITIFAVCTNIPRPQEN
jgi:hypothetical protein